jgi:hypothetical protein
MTIIRAHCLLKAALSASTPSSVSFSS